MCLVRQCKIGYVALEGLSLKEFKGLSCKMCLVRQCRIGYVALEGLTGV